jgi:hypothetical protein
MLKAALTIWTLNSVTYSRQITYVRKLSVPLLGYCLSDIGYLMRASVS